MNVHFSLLVFGVLLLWFPRRWMRWGIPFLRRRRRAGARAVVEPWRVRDAGDPRVDFREEFGKFRNYIDLLRAAAGSLVLAGGTGVAPALAAEAGSPRSVTLQVMAMRAVILLAGVLIQTLRIEKGRLALTPPIFYLAGVSMGLCDVRAAAFAFALMWAINAALPNAQGFLSVYALLMIAFGVLFVRRIDPWVMYAGVLTFLPVLLSLLTKRPLIIMARKAPRTHHL